MDMRVLTTHNEGATCVKTLTRALVAGGVAAAVAAFSAVSAASAATVQSAAASYTPYLASADSTVRQIAQCGSTMYAVGTFTSIGAPGKANVTRNNVFSFSATTGAVSSWNPNVNGTVNSIAFNAGCTSAYLGGSFSSVHGTSVSNLVEVSTSTGAVVTTFKPQPNKVVYTLLLHGTHLLVGGAFKTIGGVSRASMASLNATTGAVDSYVNLGITGTIGTGTQRVYKFSVNHAGTQLIVMGSFLQVAGQARQQTFLLDLGATSTTLDAWYSPMFNLACISRLPYYVQAATWSPDDTRMYYATTGREGVSPLCDTVSAWNATADSNQSPLWINPTACDSLFSIAADDSNVYVGGHQRWMSNFGVCESFNPGAISRTGIADVSPVDGSVTSWNPTRARGHGADDMLLTSAGLWVASDNFFAANDCAGTYHPGICFFPK
jgi:hypothetical protein